MAAGKAHENVNKKEGKSTKNLGYSQYLLLLYVNIWQKSHAGTIQVENFETYSENGIQSKEEGILICGQTADRSYL